MLNLGEQAGGNVRAMSLIHATRVLMISSLVPFAITLFWGLDLNRPPGKPAIDIPLHEIAIMILAGIGGWQIAARIGIPGSSIIGPLILTAFCTLSGLINSRPPAEMILIAQFIIGLAVEARYSGMTSEELRKYVVAGVAYTAIVGVVSVTMIFIVVRALRLEPLDALLSFLPGGQPEIPVIALAAGSDIAFVATHHILRMLLVIVFAQAFSGWLGRY
ncbi:MAG: AbrB family transcriptional regulator [Rhodobacteraceae bacterium]|nr:AbrB family transcriptional regulator [Paracoccaceae bacterium]MCY4141011.1 AbrB family transcriptional regulator [Paracoccaceae bacterium]